MAKPRKPSKPGKKIIRKRVRTSLRAKAGATARGRRMAAILGPTSGYEGYKTIEREVDVPGSAAAKERAARAGGGNKANAKTITKAKQANAKTITKAKQANTNKATATVGKRRPTTGGNTPARGARAATARHRNNNQPPTVSTRRLSDMTGDEFRDHYRAVIAAARNGDTNAAREAARLRKWGKDNGHLGADGAPKAATRAKAERDRKHARDRAAADKRNADAEKAAAKRNADAEKAAAKRNADNTKATTADAELNRQMDDAPTMAAAEHNGATYRQDTDVTPYGSHATDARRRAEIRAMSDEELADTYQAARARRDDYGHPPKVSDIFEAEDVEHLDNELLELGAELDARRNPEDNPFTAAEIDLDTSGVDIPDTVKGREQEWLATLDDDTLESVIVNAAPELSDMADEEMERRYPWRPDGVLQRMLPHRTMTDIRREQKRLLGDGNEVYGKQDIYKMAGEAGNHRYLDYAEDAFTDWFEEQRRNSTNLPVTDPKYQQELNYFINWGVDRIGSPIMMQTVPEEVREAVTRLGFIPNRANWARIQRGEAPRPYNHEMTMAQMYGRRKRRSSDEILRDKLARANKAATRAAAQREKAAAELRARAEKAEPGWTLTVADAQKAVDAATTERDAQVRAKGGVKGYTNGELEARNALANALDDLALAREIEALRNERETGTADPDKNRRDALNAELADLDAAAAINAREADNAEVRHAANASDRADISAAELADGEELTNNGNIRRGNALMFRNRDGSWSVKPLYKERADRGKGAKADTLDDARRIADRIGAGEVPNERTADNAGKKKVGKPGPNAKTVDAKAEAEKPRRRRSRRATPDQLVDGETINRMGNIEGDGYVIVVGKDGYTPQVPGHNGMETKTPEHARKIALDLLADKRKRQAEADAKFEAERQASIKQRREDPNPSWHESARREREAQGRPADTPKPKKAATREPVVDGITINRDRNNRYVVTDTNGAGDGSPNRKVGDYATIEEARAARDAEVAARKADADRRAADDDLMRLPQRERDIAVYNEVQGESYTTAEVAEMTGLTPAQARATLRRLEANGLVFRSDDNDNQGPGTRRTVSGERTSMDNLVWTDAYRDDEGAVVDAVNAYDPKKGTKKAPAKKAPAKKATAKKTTATPTVDPKKQQRAADAAEKHAKAEKAHASAVAKVERAMRENTTDRIDADTETAAIAAAKAFIRERNAKAALLRAEIAADPAKDTPETRKAIADAEKATKGAKVGNIGSPEFKAVKNDIIAAAQAKKPAIGKPTPKKTTADEPDITPEQVSDGFDQLLANIQNAKAENGGTLPTDPEFERREKHGLGRGEVLPGTLKPGDHVITPYGKARVKRVNLNNVVVENPVTADPRRALADVDDLTVFRYDHIAVPPGSDAAFREPDTTGLREGTAKIGDYPNVSLGRNPHRSDYYTTAELEERGWTPAKLKSIVGKPDGVKKFREKIAADGDGSQRGDYGGYNVNLYSRARIELAEADHPEEDFGPHRAPEVPAIEGLDIERVATEAGRTIFRINNAKDLAGDADLSSAWLDAKGRLNVRGEDKARDRIQAVIDNGPITKPDPRVSRMAEPGSVLTPDGVADAKKQAAETKGADLPDWFPAALNEVEGDEGGPDYQVKANTRILNNRAMREGIVKSDDGGHTIDEEQRARFAAVEKLSDKDLKALAANRSKNKPNHAEATLESIRRGNLTSRRSGPTDVERLIGGIAFGDIDPGDVSLAELEAIADYSRTFDFTKERNNSWHFVSDIVGWAGPERTRRIESDVEATPDKYLDLIRNNEAMPEGVDPAVVERRLKSLSSTDYGIAVEQGRVNALKFDADPKYRDLVDDNTRIKDLTDAELEEAHRLYRENNPARGVTSPSPAEKKFADTLAALTQETRERQLEREAQESKRRREAREQGNGEDDGGRLPWDTWKPTHRSVPLESLPDSETFDADFKRVPVAASEKGAIRDRLDEIVEEKNTRAMELFKSKDNSPDDMEAYARAALDANDARIARLSTALDYDIAREEIAHLLRFRDYFDKQFRDVGLQPLAPRRTLGDYLDEMGVPGGRNDAPDPRMSRMAEPGSVLTPNGVEAAAPSIDDQIRDVVRPGGKVAVARRKAEQESPLGVKRRDLAARMKSHPEKDTMPPSSRSLEWHQMNVELAEAELAGAERRLAQFEQDIADFKSQGATDKQLAPLEARRKSTQAAVDKTREQVQTARKQASAKEAEQALAADAKAPGGNKWEVTKRDEYPIKSTKIGPDKKSPDEVAQWLAEFATTFKGDRKSSDSVSVQFQDAMSDAWHAEGNAADVDFYLGMLARGTDVQDAEFMVGTPGVAAIDAEKLARTRSAKSARKIIDEGIAEENRRFGVRLAREIVADENRNDPRELSFVVFALTDGNVRDKYGRVPKNANAEEARLAANIAERLHRVDPDGQGYGFDGVAQAFREVADWVDPDGATPRAETLDPRSSERIMRETARAELGTDGDLVIEHTPEGGTLIHGTSRGDGTSEVLKANGWRWSRNLGAWYVPRSRDQRPDGNKIDRTATALEAAGHKVGTDIDDTVRSAAEREAAKAQRADDRAEALADKASRKRAAADTAWQKDKEATDRVPPMGEPVKVGHHSERGHRRAIERAWQTLGNAIEAEKDAKEADRRAKVAARANDARNNPVTVANRIDKLEADIRRMERNRVTGPELDTARDDLTYWQGVHEQHIADGKIASQNPADYKPGMFLVQNRRLYRIAKVNKKTLSVEGEGVTEGKQGARRIKLSEITGYQVTPEEAEALLREQVEGMSDDDLRNKITAQRGIYGYGQRDAMKAELARREGTEPPAPEMPLTPPKPGAYEKHQRGRILKRHVKVDEGETYDKGKIKRGDFTIGNSQRGYTVTDASGNSFPGEPGERFDIDVARERVDALQADRDLLGRDSEVLGMSDASLARVAETGSGDRRRDAQELLAAREAVAKERARNFDEYVDEAEAAAALTASSGFAPPGSVLGPDGIIRPGN